MDGRGGAGTLNCLRPCLFPQYCHLHGLKPPISSMCIFNADTGKWVI